MEPTEFVKYPQYAQHSSILLILKKKKYIFSSWLTSQRADIQNCLCFPNNVQQLLSLYSSLFNWQDRGRCQLANNGRGSFLTQLFKNRRMSSTFHFCHFAAQRCQQHLENLLTQSVLCSRSTEDSQCPSAHPGLPTQLFCLLFLCLIIFISPWTLTCKKGAISELSVQRLYLHSANVGVSQYAALSRQFSQRPNVINGCHLRGAEWGWKRKGGKKVIQRR